MKSTSEMASEPVTPCERVIDQIAARMRTSPHKLTVYGDKGKFEYAYEALYPRVIAVAARLRRRLGTQARIGLVAENSIDFVIIDLACIAAGLCTVCIDEKSALAADTIDYFTGLSVQVVVRREQGSENGEPPKSSLDVVSYSELLDPREDEAIDERPPYHWSDGQFLTIKQTSGSTGVPKAIGATVSSIDDTLTLVQSSFAHNAQDRILVFLPLYLVQQRYWIYSSIYFGFDVILTSWKYVLSVMGASSPTVVMGVPKFYEILKDRIQFKAGLISSSDPIREATRAVLGSSIRYLWTGSAPCSRVALDFFWHLGIPLFEGYGTNETDIISKNTFSDYKLGSVGKVLPNRKVSLSPSGQISVWKRHCVTTQYELGEDTTGGFEGNVYVTGDLGTIDEDGYLFITGRVGDAFVLESGATIHPREVEMQIEKSDLIDFAVVCGQNRPFLVALVDPRARSVDRKTLEQAVYTITSNAGSAKRVGRIVVSHEPFSEQNGCLSPQKKIVRRRILEKYREEIEACYTV